MPTEALRKSIDRQLEAHDRAGAIEVALNAVSTGGVGIVDLYDVLSDVLVDVGASWQAGSTEVWQEHLVTSVVRNIVEACAPVVSESLPEPIGRTVILATPPDEFHDLGLRMLADRFALAGWTVHLLGASVPVDQLIDAISELGADGVALSVSTHFSRLTLRPYVEAVKAAQPDLVVWVGGPAFRNEASTWFDEEMLDISSLSSSGSG